MKEEGEEERYMPDEKTSTKKSSKWEALVHAPCIKKHIKSLDAWNFLSNFDINLSKEKYLVVGLQGIVLCVTVTPPEKYRSDHIVQYIAGNELCTHYVKFRPMLEDFFEIVSKWYTVVLYTSMERKFADGVVKYLERKGRIFKKRLYREDCDYMNGGFVKNLEKVSMDSSSIVSLHYDFKTGENILPIDVFTGSSKDRHLLSSIIILDSLRFCSDVRSILNLAQL